MTDDLPTIIRELRERKVNSGKHTSVTLHAWADRLEKIAMPSHHWSFDDYNIGTTTSDRQAIAIRHISRPPGVIRSEWYSHAAQICALLNNPLSL